MNVPPLLTSSTAVTPGINVGSLADPNARIIFGGDRINENARPGFRVTAGMWLDDECRLGIQGSFFMLESQATGFTGGSLNSNLIVARPFTNALNGVADAQLVSFPGSLAGVATIASRSSNIYGADVLLRCNLCCGCDYRFDVVGGYRHLHLGDSMAISENLVPLSAPFVSGTRIQVFDSFKTNNDFHGATVGFLLEKCCGRWGLEVMPRLGVGNVSRTVQIAGSTSVSVPGVGVATSTGGLLTQTTNIGTYHSSAFSLVPELDLRVSYRICSSARVFVGYNGIYWTQVARAGNQIDTSVNRDLIPPPRATVGPQRPAFNLNPTDVWMHGLQVGLELRF